MGSKEHHSSDLRPLNAKGKVVPFPVSAGSDITVQRNATGLAEADTSSAPSLQQVEANYVGALLTRALRRVKGSGYISTLMVLRLCDHRELDETFGQHLGKHLMQQCAQRLKDCLRANDVFKQISDDEFAIVPEQISSIEQVSRLSEILAAHCSGNYVSDELSVSLRAAIGIVEFPKFGREYAELIRFARLALRDASAQHTPGHGIFSKKRLIQKREQLCMFGEVHRAVQEERLQLHFQPQYALANGRIVGLEALVRMQSETGELIAPDQFIPIAEEHGLIAQIGRWVIHEACDQLRRWHEQGHRELRVAVNVSPHQLRDASLLTVIDAAVARAGIDYSDLELEITERSIIENLPEVLEILRELSDKGVRIAVDDFGTGYSSFSYLAELPVNVFKMDRSFLTKITTGGRARQVVSAMIAMARELDFEIVAEGVETEEQYLFLQTTGCNFCQGFGLARPDAAAAIEKRFLTNQKLVPVSKTY